MDIYPNNEFSGRVKIHLANIYQKEARDDFNEDEGYDYGRAIKLYDEVYTKFPETSYGEQALFMLGACYADEKTGDQIRLRKRP